MDRIEHFSRLIEGWLWETDRQHRFVYLSANVEKYTGIKAEQHYGKSRLEMKRGEIDGTDWEDHLKELELHKPFYNFKFRRAGPDRIRWISTSGEPFFDDAGEFQGYRGAARNITGEVALALEAESAKSQLFNALEIMDEGFVYYDADDCLVHCNEKYREYYPKSRHLIIPGARFEDILRGGAYLGEYKHAIGREEEWVAERMALHAQPNLEIEQNLGDGRWLRIAERITPDGGMVGMRVDVTSLKNARSQAEIANQAKSNFLSTMSHEIRTPLNGMLGVAQLLAKTNLDSDQLIKVQTILSSGDTLLAIINDVLDMSKIEAGGLELEKTDFSLQNLISGITSPFQTLAEEKNLTLKSKTQLDSSLHLIGDPVRLRQILWNLISNALKFTDEGSVTLSIEEVRDTKISDPSKGNLLLHFCVKDTGSGIAPDRLENIFSAFTQEDSSITRRYGGTGLGLAIVKRLTELMKGHIEVNSEPGKGTTFDIYLPFQIAAQIEKTSESPATDKKDKALSTSPLKVLVAEDNIVNAMIITSFMELFGHEVRHVENGRLAVDAAAEGWADFVFMDIHMPDMDGVEATRIIRASESGANLPIIGLTAEAFTERHEEFIKAGMNSVVPKPFTEEQLLRTIAQYR